MTRCSNTRHEMFAGRGRRGLRTARCLIYAQSMVRCGAQNWARLDEGSRKQMTAVAKRVSQALRSKLNGWQAGPETCGHRHHGAGDLTSTVCRPSTRSGVTQSGVVGVTRFAQGGGLCSTNLGWRQPLQDEPQGSGSTC